MNSYKLGKWPFTHDDRTLRLSHYFSGGKLPSAATSLDLTAKVQNPWPMDANDQLGDCVIEGTEVVAPGVRRVYRGKYSGPVVRIKLLSGKDLTVTPNHAVLTPNGFVAAKLLRKGGYVVSSRFPERVAALVDSDFHNMPTRIEEIAAAHLGVGTLGGVTVNHIVPRAHHFHGDGKFFDGEIDTVAVDGLLENDRQSSALQPESKKSLLSGGMFPGIGLTPTSHEFKGDRGVALAAPRRVSGGTLGGSHLSGLMGIANEARLTHRSELYASPRENADQAVSADPEIFGELMKRCSVLVAQDEIVEIESDGIWTGHVYDLSTERNWYIANGVIIHNCTCAAAGHMVQLWSAMVGQEIVPATQDVVKMYYAITGSPDVGANESNVLQYWKANPLDQWAPAAYLACDPNDPNHIKIAASLFGGVYIGVQLPASAQRQIGSLWDVVSPTDPSGQPGSWGGHAVNVVGYDADTVTVVTWGKTQKMSWAFWAAYCDEAWAILPNDWEKAPGIDWAALQADLAAL